MIEVRCGFGFGLGLRLRLRLGLELGFGLRHMPRLELRLWCWLWLRLRLGPRSPAGVQVADDGCTGVSRNAETRESAVAAAGGLPHGGQG